MTTNSIDLAFALIGTAPLPADHGFQLYGAISRALPAVHEPNGIAIHPIRGRQIGERQMALCEWSKLTIRAAADRIADLLPLAGKQLTIAGRPLRAVKYLRICGSCGRGSDGDNRGEDNAKGFKGGHG
jgi:CRISPR-associated protein Cas6